MPRQQRSNADEEQRAEQGELPAEASLDFQAQQRQCREHARARWRQAGVGRRGPAGCCDRMGQAGLHIGANDGFWPN